MVKRLLQKGYYKKVKAKLERNIIQLKKTQKYLAFDIENIYDKYSDENKKYITPIEKTVNSIIREWQNEECEVYDSYKENLKYHTEKGEIVRSKSELLIANTLYRNSDKLDYRYEKSIELVWREELIIIHPDFTVINLKTGKKVYWEHAGKMDDLNYVNKFIKKINIYIDNGFVIGKDIIITYENMMYPLDTTQIKNAIRQIL